MRPVLVGGRLWRVVQVEPYDARLVDRTGTSTVATTDPTTGTICISRALGPEMIDRVLIHEMAHAVSLSHGVLEELHRLVPERSWVAVEEWSARLIERYGLEAVEAASQALGRPVCVEGVCHGERR